MTDRADLSSEVARARAARHAVGEVYAYAARAVEALPARDAFDEATELAEALRAQAEDAAGLRAREAARLAREQGLSVRALAAELGMSPSNAGDLLARAARDQARPAD